MGLFASLGLEFGGVICCSGVASGLVSIKAGGACTFVCLLSQPPHPRWVYYIIWFLALNIFLVMFKACWNMQDLYLPYEQCQKLSTGPLDNLLDNCPLSHVWNKFAIFGVIFFLFWKVCCQICLGTARWTMWTGHCLDNFKH